MERFTFRPSASESALGNPPFLPPEIQYWAGVIMRNACRKDESRGGIRQCANSESTELSDQNGDFNSFCASALREVGNVPKGIRQMPKVSKGKVLW